MSQQNVEITRRGFEAVNSHELDALLKLMDPDVVAVPRIIGVEGGAFRGHDGIRDWWDGVFGAFRDFKIEILDVRAMTDVTLASLRVRGYGRGSGARFEDAIWIVSRLRSGKVVWWQTCGSEAEALEAAGLSE